jgi:hypothetical protein
MLSDLNSLEQIRKEELHKVELRKREANLKFFEDLIGQRAEYAPKVYRLIVKWLYSSGYSGQAAV